MTATLEQLQAAIQQLTSTQAQFIADVQALLAKLPVSPDYEAEVQAIQNALASLINVDAAVKAATPADAEPEEQS